MEIELIIWIYCTSIESLIGDSFKMENIESWRKYNSHCQIILLNPDNLHLYIKNANLEDETSIGLNVLYNFGGIFTTSCVRCQRKLSTMKFQDDIWLFGLYDSKNGLICLPWFIISIARNELIKKWVNYSMQQQPTPKKVNNIINKLIYSDQEFDDLWEKHAKFENGRKCYAPSQKNYLDNIEKTKGCAIIFIDNQSLDD